MPSFSPLGAADATAAFSQIKVTKPAVAIAAEFGLPRA